eukprot:876768-Alexandrium_andersonii.AAC.1
MHACFQGSAAPPTHWDPLWRCRCPVPLMALLSLKMELPAVAVAALAHAEESARERALRALLRSPPEALVPHVDVL